MKDGNGILGERQAKLVAQSSAADILDALYRNQMIPSRRELKRMVNQNKWAELGRLFHFTPVYHFASESWIDWRCVPQGLCDILQMREPKSVRPPRLAKKTTSARKSLASKSDARMGVREHLYAIQSGVCHYCGSYVVFAAWTVDHKNPRARGGKNQEENRVGCCNTCNHAKGPLTYNEFMATEYMGGAIPLKDAVRNAFKSIRGAFAR